MAEISNNIFMMQQSAQSVMLKNYVECSNIGFSV